ncbi:hypothetical protein MEBOL_001143 [Melittangium boletus DSM 14713]|uniref:Ternary complex associated domain-containing protein n=1 Tax=Melittangium boletus DSM 14713 TaxID=1294270 RepID=A0A250I749_9BACT|nr:hypothetical protein MEBOL_001143 [Melittangium boletus DSM 14713]
MAYFAHAVDESKRRTASQPLVVKIGASNKLRAEKDGAEKWPRLTGQERSKFAFPLQLDETDPERAVLVAPFQSLSEMQPDGSRHKVEVRDLWRLLENKNEPNPAHTTDWNKIRRLIAEALDSVEPSHRAGRARPKAETTTYADQYEWYLRETTNDKAKHLPRLLFGTEARTRVFGREWPNPTEVVRRIIRHGMSFSGILGAVHGDLHPKNIVLTGYDGVQIIDFGWATNPRHVVVDYVLLDLNLRGTTLPSQIDEGAILSLASFLNLHDDLDALPTPVRARAEVIRNVIWEKAKKRAIEKDWTAEYLVPLLLVGYGLLVHLDSARNQPALIATVLQLSELLEPTVLAATTV